MDTTKIHLSQEEMELLKNSRWILTKNAVIEKVILGMAGLLTQMQQEVKEKKYLMRDIVDSSGKISRGEKYGGLPYVMLDYPRVFDKENIIAIRTLFWWGNFCSVTLHLKGRYQLLIAEKIRAEIPTLLKHDLYISVSGDEWNHNVSVDNYRPLNSIDQKDLFIILQKAAFFKLTGKVELDQWEKMEGKLFTLFEALLNLCSDSIEEIF
ncbi:MAG TPA: hypothetical protein VEZ17_19135 [Chitinophagaceae bacterium]|nr:hypothetical protein [Chitinophagaceae bacterium]